MLTARSLTYRGWNLCVIPTNSGTYKFQTCPPEGDPLSPGQVFEDVSVCETAARTFIEKNIARGSIGDLLDEWLDARKISHQDYRKMLEAIAPLMKI